MASWGISEKGWRKGPWTPEEDKFLIEYVSQNGEGRWSSVSKCAGLNRSGKSCRLRWVNYLRPGLKKGHMTPQEEGIIIELHALWGNKWSTIARYLPGRTDNEIKNYWRTHFKTRKPTHVNEEKKKLAKHKSQQKVDDQNNTSHEEKTSKKETHIAENHQILPIIYEENSSWFDLIPSDSYSWGGLWSFDDQINGCSKMAIQNHANNNKSYSCEGDASNYMHNGGYIF